MFLPLLFLSLALPHPLFSLSLPLSLFLSPSLLYLSLVTLNHSESVPYRNGMHLFSEILDFFLSSFSFLLFLRKCYDPMRWFVCNIWIVNDTTDHYTVHTKYKRSQFAHRRIRSQRRLHVKHILWNSIMRVRCTQCSGMRMIAPYATHFVCYLGVRSWYGFRSQWNMKCNSRVLHYVRCTWWTM